MATLRTRNLKVQCGDCAYSVYTTRKWLAAYGAPLCPNPECSDYRKPMFSDYCAQRSSSEWSVGSA